MQSVQHGCKAEGHLLEAVAMDCCLGMVGTTASSPSWGASLGLGADSDLAARAAVTSRLSFSFVMPCAGSNRGFISTAALPSSSTPCNVHCAQLLGLAVLLQDLAPGMEAVILQKCDGLGICVGLTLSSGELREADSSLGMPCGCRKPSLATLGWLQPAGTWLKGLSGGHMSAL
jgi:hypothetical protein